jgi:hypothetical protein
VNERVVDSSDLWMGLDIQSSFIKLYFSMTGHEMLVLDRERDIAEQALPTNNMKVFCLFIL